MMQMSKCHTISNRFNWMHNFYIGAEAVLRGFGEFARRKWVMPNDIRFEMRQQNIEWLLWALVAFFALHWTVKDSSRVHKKKKRNEIHMDVRDRVSPNRSDNGDDLICVRQNACRPTRHQWRMAFPVFTRFLKQRKENRFEQKRRSEHVAVVVATDQYVVIFFFLTKSPPFRTSTYLAGNMYFTWNSCLRLGPANNNDWYENRRRYLWKRT